MSTIERALKNGLTVKELMEELENCNPDDKIVFAYNYNDYPRTTVCQAVENVDEGKVKWSEYHRMPKLLSMDKEDDPDGHGVVVINMQ